MCCIKYVILKQYDFTDGDSLYEIYIDKNKCTWQQVMREVNRVKSVKFNYISLYFYVELSTKRINFFLHFCLIILALDKVNGIQASEN